MAQPQAPRDLFSPHREHCSEDPAGGSKCRVPSWSGAENLSLLKLWGEEDTLLDRRSRHRMWTYMAGWPRLWLRRDTHPLRLEQIRSKYKEFRQGYARARERSSRCGAGPRYCPCYQELHQILEHGEALSSLVVVDSGLQMPVATCPELSAKEEEEEEEQLHEEDTASTGTLILELIPQALEISQASLEGSSAGPGNHHQPRQPPNPGGATSA
ncbi:uncharacterized protein LOC142828960 [Pelodiscus sinensis]|uniref:uncharacterized protein LOC142828960 n=1 Tax=Pelodiscus sinensis TaxID=13735 RepID=UPI003F6AF839